MIIGESFKTASTKKEMDNWISDEVIKRSTCKFSSNV